MVDPILYKTRDNPILINEQVVVRGSKAILKEVPDRFYKVKINGYTEVNNIDHLNIEDGHFYVDYLMGEIHFPAYVGNDAQFTASYYGTGYSLYPASRMYLHLQDHDTIEQTLQDALTKAEKGIKIVHEISDIDDYVNEGKILRSDLNSKITTGTTLNTDLGNTITTATNRNNLLNTAITDAIEVDEGLNDTIDYADEVFNMQYRTIDGGDFGDEYVISTYDGGTFDDVSTPLKALNGGDFMTGVVEWQGRSSKYMYINSEGGNRFKLTISDNGTITTEPIT